MSQDIYTEEYKQKHRCPSRIYRKIWCEYHSEKIPKGFEIHHLDGNSWNNTRENILCIPRRIHYWVHYWQKDGCDKILEGKTRCGWTISPEHREILRQANLGKVCSQESRERMSKAKIGKPLPENHKKNISAALVGNTYRKGKKASETTKINISRGLVGNQNALGNKLSKETRQKMSLVRRGKTQSEETRRKIGEAKRKYWARRRGETDV